MLSRGFKDQIYDVYRYLPPELQVSATLQKTTLSKFNIILRKQILFSPRSPPPSTTASIILQSVYYNISCASENEHEEQELILVKSLTLYWK
jgi:hypothetical protein